MCIRDRFVDSTSYYTSKYSGEEIDALLDGRGISIKGSYPSLSAIEAAFPDGDDAMYLAQDTGYVYTWNDTTHEWESLGSIVGPKGEKGD